MRSDMIALLFFDDFNLRMLDCCLGMYRKINGPLVEVVRDFCGLELITPGSETTCAAFRPTQFRTNQTSTELKQKQPS